MKNIRKYIDICWLIGCKEDYGECGYSICYCGRGSYYDYDDYNYGLINWISSGFDKYLFKGLQNHIDELLYPYIRFCSYCHKPDYFMGINLYEKYHKNCLPFQENTRIDKTGILFT